MAAIFKTISDLLTGVPFKTVPFEKPQAAAKRPKLRKRILASNPPFKEWRRKHRAKQSQF